MASVYNMEYQGNRGALSARFAGMNARLGQSMIGRSLQQGAMESFGWNFYKGENLGFLGKVPERQVTSTMFGQAGKAAGPGRGVVGKAFGTLGRSIGLLGTAYFAYEGYQQNGILGAMGGIAESVAWSAGFKLAGAVMGAGVLPVAATIGAIAGATYLAGEAGRAHAKGLRQMEMGGGDQMMQAITSAGAATARQRAATALDNTHLNARMALGNEGFFMHKRFAERGI